ncbi:MAG: MvaI/BcnI family restriction endonuclease [Minisyncoccales bacterium]
MNPLEDKVKSILEDNNWKTDIGLHYKDPATGLPREKDIIVTSQQLENYKNYNLNYNAKIFIECKMIPKSTEVYYSNDEEIENVILSNKLPYVDASEMERNKKFHTYSFPKTINEKNSGDLLYKAINQNLQSFSAYREEYKDEKGIYFLCVIFDDLEHKAGTRLPNTFYVQAKVMMKIKKEFYKYTKVLMLQRFDSNGFLKVLRKEKLS